MHHATPKQRCWITSTSERNGSYFCAVNSHLFTPSLDFFVIKKNMFCKYTILLEIVLIPLYQNAPIALPRARLGAFGAVLKFWYRVSRLKKGRPFSILPRCALFLDEGNVPWGYLRWQRHFLECFLFKQKDACFMRTFLDVSFYPLTFWHRYSNSWWRASRDILRLKVYFLQSCCYYLVGTILLVIGDFFKRANCLFRYKVDSMKLYPILSSVYLMKL